MYDMKNACLFSDFLCIAVYFATNCIFVVFFSLLILLAGYGNALFVVFLYQKGEKFGESSSF